VTTRRRYPMPGYWAEVHLALGSFTISTSGWTPTIALRVALGLARRRGWTPTAVKLYRYGVGVRVIPPQKCRWTKRRGLSSRRFQDHWFSLGADLRWHRGLWCFGCARYARDPGRIGGSRYWHSCGDALWLSPLDPGPAFPQWYAPKGHQ
jgi:hypothetical protein